MRRIAIPVLLGLLLAVLLYALPEAHPGRADNAYPGLVYIETDVYGYPAPMIENIPNIPTLAPPLSPPERY